MEQRATNMGRLYSWYAPGGTFKIKIYEHGDSVSVTYIDEFLKHFLIVNNLVSVFFLCRVFIGFI